MTQSRSECPNDQPEPVKPAARALRSRRICIFTPTFLPTIGGTEIVTDALARRLHAAGIQVTVLAQGTPAPLDVPYEVRWYPKPRGVRWWPERTAQALAALHAETPFSLFCVNYANPTGYGAVLLGRKLGVPVVLVSHGGDLFRNAKDRRRPRIWKRTCRAYQQADALVTISASVEKLIREIAPEPPPLCRIPNGIDLALYREPAPRPADVELKRPFCLCLGTLNKQKGFEDAVSALALTREALEDLMLVIVGEGPLEGALRAQVSRLNLDDRILFAGRRVGAEKRWFLQHCRFGIMPSIEEGHPVVGLEFLAAGKPLICTTHGAFDDMCHEGRNSLRVEPRAPDQLARAIRNLHRSDQEAMGRESRRIAEAYDWDLITQKYIDWFEQVLHTYRRFV